MRTKGEDRGLVAVEAPGEGVAPAEHRGDVRLVERLGAGVRKKLRVPPLLVLGARRGAELLRREVALEAERREGRVARRDGRAPVDKLVRAAACEM